MSDIQINRITEKLIKQYDFIKYEKKNGLKLFVLTIGSGIMMAIADMLFEKYDLIILDIGQIKDKSYIIDWFCTHYKCLLIFWISITNIKQIESELLERNHKSVDSYLYLAGINCNFNIWKYMNYKELQSLTNLNLL